MSGRLYRKSESGRYVPVNDPHAYDGLGNGSWIVVVKKGSVTIRKLINPKCLELEAALYYLEEGLCEAMSKKAKMRPRDIPMSKKEIGAWKKFEKTMGKDMPRYFEFAAYQEIADAGCQYLRKIIVENDFDIKKIREAIAKIEDTTINPIKELEV